MSEKLTSNHLNINILNSNSKNIDTQIIKKDILRSPSYDENIHQTIFDSKEKSIDENLIDTKIATMYHSPQIQNEGLLINKNSNSHQDIKAISDKNQNQNSDFLGIQQNSRGYALSNKSVNYFNNYENKIIIDHIKNKHCNLRNIRFSEEDIKLEKKEKHSAKNKSQAIQDYHQAYNQTDAISNDSLALYSPPLKMFDSNNQNDNFRIGNSNKITGDMEYINILKKSNSNYETPNEVENTRQSTKKYKSHKELQASNDDNIAITKHDFKVEQNEEIIITKNRNLVKIFGKQIISVLKI